MVAHLVVCTAIVLASAGATHISDVTQVQLRAGDPAVDADTTFVQGKKLREPVDLEFVVAALDRLVSAAEGLALGEAHPDGELLAAALEARREIRLLRPSEPSTPKRVKRRWIAFNRSAEVVDALAEELGPRGAPKSLREAVLRAADSIDYDDPLRWQPHAIEIFFDLAARALTQMADAKVGPASRTIVAETRPEGIVLRSTKDIDGYSIVATDGTLGTVGDLYFDDDVWTVRYVTRLASSLQAGSRQPVVRAWSCSISHSLV